MNKTCPGCGAFYSKKCDYCGFDPDSEWIKETKKAILDKLNSLSNRGSEIQSAVINAGLYDYRKIQ